MTLTDFFGNGCSDVRWRCGERIPWLAMTGTRYCGMTVKVVRRSHSSDNSPASTRRPAAMPYRGKVREVLQWTQANGALRDMVCRPGLPFIFGYVIGRRSGSGAKAEPAPRQGRIPMAR